MAPIIKTRPDFPKLDNLYTGMADNSLSRIQSSVRHIPPEALAQGIGSSGVFGKVAEDEGDDDYPGDFDYQDEETQKLAEALSQEEAEAELHAGAVSHYLYSDFGAILSADRRNGSVEIETFDDEESMYDTWDQHMLASRRREY